MSDHEAARDLAGDIVYEAMRAVRLGVKIDNFTAWYWRMARNKYADYARTKVIRPLPIEEAAAVESVYEEADRRLVSEEELTSLAQALSRLAATHREIVVRYYLGQESVAQIAKELNIPQGTVKGRLFDARKNLKERITTMEQKGKNISAKQTYKPADLDSYFGGYAWQSISALGHTLAQQIAFVCRNGKKTVQEMSDEIEAPAVYLEDYLTSLVKAGVVKEAGGNHYLTDFCIFPGDIYQEALKKKHALCLEQNIPQKVVASLLSVKDKITSLDFYGNTFDYNYLLWFLYVQAMYAFSDTATAQYQKRYNDSHPNRQITVEEYERQFHVNAQFYYPEEKSAVELWTSNDTKKRKLWSTIFDHYNSSEYGHIMYANTFDAPPFEEGIITLPDGRITRDRQPKRSYTFLTHATADLYILLTQNPEHYLQHTLNEAEQETVKQFLSNGVMVHDNGTIPVFTWPVWEEVKKKITEAMKPLAKKFEPLISCEVEKTVLPHVRDDLRYEFASSAMTDYLRPIHHLLWYGMNEGHTLSLPEDYATSCAGLFIVHG